MKRLPIVALLFSIVTLNSIPAMTSTPNCSKEAPVSFEVYQYQKSYVAIIIVDGGSGYIDSLDKPHMGIGFYNDSPAVDVPCKDYGDVNQSVDHIFACTYPTDMTSLLTVAGFTLFLKNDDSCYMQKWGILPKAVLFTETTSTIAQCVSPSIVNADACTSMVKDAILGKPVPAKMTSKDPSTPAKDPYAQPKDPYASGSASTTDCPKPGYFDEVTKTCIGAQTQEQNQKQQLCGSGNYYLLGGGGACGSECGDKKVVKMGKCVCINGYMQDPNAKTNCIVDPSANVNLPVSPTSGGGSCSLIR